MAHELYLDKAIIFESALKAQAWAEGPWPWPWLRAAVGNVGSARLPLDGWSRGPAGDGDLLSASQRALGCSDQCSLHPWDAMARTGWGASRGRGREGRGARWRACNGGRRGLGP